MELSITEKQVSEDDFETIIVEKNKHGSIVRTIATFNVPAYAELFLNAYVDDLDMQNRITALETAVRNLVLELNEHHTINDIHPHVFKAQQEVNKILDAALLGKE